MTGVRSADVRARIDQVAGAPQRAFDSDARTERTAALLGLALGVTFAVCFLTGLVSHYLQEPRPDAWFPRPAGLYRVNQGVHVATGIASVPLLLAKLWAVVPKFYAWPPFRSPAQAIERLALLPLVGGSLFMLFSGVGNIELYRPWRFDFTTAHYWAAWITIGGLIVHIGAKLPVTKRALGSTVEPGSDEDGTNADRAVSDEVAAQRLGRRRLLGTVAAAGGVLTLATIGQTLRPLRAVSVLGPRDPAAGPQGVPVNRTARQAQVTDVARSPDYRFTIEHGADTMELSLADLEALPLHEATLPIACVEGWSSDGVWRGVRVRDLLEMVGARPGATATVHSMQPGSRFTSSYLDSGFCRDADTLLALRLGGEPLHIDHGYPLRLIAPNRSGVLQTKWLDRIVIT